MVSPFDKQILLTSEITILRLNSNTLGLTSFYLLFALSQPKAQSNANK